MMGKTYVQIGKPHNVKRLLASEGKLVEGMYQEFLTERDSEVSLT